MPIKILLNLGHGLLRAQNGRLAFHGAGTGHPSYGFRQGELTLLTDFPFRFGIGLGALAVLVVVHTDWLSRSAGLPWEGMSKICTD